MKQIGYGKDYRYVHSDPRAKEEMECLPEQLRGRKYFSEEQEQTKGEDIGSDALTRKSTRSWLSCKTFLSHPTGASVLPN